MAPIGWHTQLNTARDRRDGRAKRDWRRFAVLESLNSAAFHVSPLAPFSLVAHHSDLARHAGNWVGRGGKR